MTCSSVELSRWGIRHKMRELMLSFSMQSESADLEMLEG